MATLTNISYNIRLSIDLIKRGGETPDWFVCDVYAEQKDLSTERWRPLFSTRRESFEENDVLTLMENIRDLIDDKEKGFNFIPSRIFFEFGAAYLNDNTLECNLLMDLQWELSKTVLDEKNLDPATVDLLFNISTDELLRFAEAFEEEHHRCLR